MMHDETLDTLRERIPKGATVYTILRHVSKSGMSRIISAVAVIDGEPRELSMYVAEALGWPVSKKERALKVQGCGMDMGFHLVASLSRVLYGEDYAIRHRWL